MVARGATSLQALSKTSRQKASSAARQDLSEPLMSPPPAMPLLGRETSNVAPETSHVSRPASKGKTSPPMDVDRASRRGSTLGPQDTWLDRNRPFRGAAERRQHHRPPREVQAFELGAADAHEHPDDDMAADSSDFLSSSEGEPDQGGLVGVAGDRDPPRTSYLPQEESGPVPGTGARSTSPDRSGAVLGKADSRADATRAGGRAAGGPAGVDDAPRGGGGVGSNHGKIRGGRDGGTRSDRHGDAGRHGLGRHGETGVRNMECDPYSRGAAPAKPGLDVEGKHAGEAREHGGGEHGGDNAGSRPLLGSLDLGDEWEDYEDSSVVTSDDSGGSLDSELRALKAQLTAIERKNADLERQLEESEQARQHKKLLGVINEGSQGGAARIKVADLQHASSLPVRADLQGSDVRDGRELYNALDRRELGDGGQDKERRKDAGGEVTRDGRPRRPLGERSRDRDLLLDALDRDPSSSQGGGSGKGRGKGREERGTARDVARGAARGGADHQGGLRRGAVVTSCRERKEQCRGPAH
eukprot:jgi/Mesvir1/12356/Mv00539-RA.1